MKVEAKTYKRTWKQDNEFGLLKSMPYESIPVDEARILFCDLIKSANKIAILLVILLMLNMSILWCLFIANSISS